MGIRVSNLRLPVEEPEAALPNHLARVLGVSAPELTRWRIVRKALDLRDKRHLRFVYNFEVDLPTDYSAAWADQRVIMYTDMTRPRMLSSTIVCRMVLLAARWSSCQIPQPPGTGKKARVPGNKKRPPGPRQR